jgi:hypothetical protein
MGKPTEIPGDRIIPSWKSTEVLIGGRGFSCISFDVASSSATPELRYAESARAGMPRERLTHDTESGFVGRSGPLGAGSVWTCEVSVLSGKWSGVPSVEREPSKATDLRYGRETALMLLAVLQGEGDEPRSRHNQRKRGGRTTCDGTECRGNPKRGQTLHPSVLIDVHELRINIGSRTDKWR